MQIDDTSTEFASDNQDLGNLPVSTLIFMDLETTGLPGHVGKKNVQVTEMSFIAIDRNDFETDSSLRVLNKLSLSVRPRSRISPGAMYITGLYNDVLQYQEEFDDSIPKMLEFFFRRLRPPICLLAHNGKKFDFPVLQAELKRLNYCLDCSILCADTLEGFRTICKNVPTVEEISPKEKLGNASNSNKVNMVKHDQMEMNMQVKNNTDNDDIEKLLLDDIESFQNIEEPVGSDETSEKNIYEDSNTTLNQIKTSVKFISVFDDEHTPSRNKGINTENVKKVHKRSRSDILDKNGHDQEKGGNMSPYPIAAKRKLFADQRIVEKSATNADLQKIVGFSVEKLYYHFFGEPPPQSHYAEADCIALSKICQKVQTEFLNWLDNNYTVFSEIESLW